MTTRRTRSGWQALHKKCLQIKTSLLRPPRGTLNRPSGKKRAPRTPLAGDLLRPKTLKDLLARQAEERRLAEEAEDREIREWDEEICAHPIGHPGHVPHGCA